MRLLLMVLVGCAMHAKSWASAPVDVVILCDAGYPPYSYAEAQNDLNWLVEGPWLSGEAGYLGYTRLNASAYLYKPKFMQSLDKVLAELDGDDSIERLVKSYDLVNPFYSPGDGI
jgi:hypothetical protein